jgi:dTDP-4-dehydrorhamnose 3,5-epimerase-like enzyme
MYPVDTTWVPGSIDGVWYRAAAFHPDDRGSFGELWQQSWLQADADFGRLEEHVARRGPGRARAWAGS